MGSEAHTADVLDLLVQPFRGAIGFVEFPGVLDALAVLLYGVSRLTDGGNLALGVFVYPFRETGMPGIESGHLNDVVEFP